MGSQHVVEDIFDQVEDAARGADRVSVDDLLSTFGNRAYGPVIFVIGLIALSPLGAIPGASILFASLIVLMALQYALRDGAPWLPRALLDRRVDADRARDALARVRPYAARAQVLFTQRAVALASRPWTWLWAAIMCALALAMYPLALVPGGAAPPALALAFMGLALTARDGAALAISGAFGVVACLGIGLAIF